MSYKKQNFTNGNKLKASELNHIEDGIIALEDEIACMKETPDDNTITLHSWSKYTIGGAIAETMLDAVYVDLTQRDYVDGRVYYSSNLRDGELALDNPTLIDLYDSIQANREVILGQYINLVKKGGYYRVPNDAVIVASKPATGYHYISISPAYSLAYYGTDGELVDTVTSADRNAYPDDGDKDGYKYVYNGTVEVSGSTGTGVGIVDIIIEEV